MCTQIHIVYTMYTEVAVLTWFVVLFSIFKIVLIIDLKLNIQKKGFSDSVQIVF